MSREDEIREREQKATKGPWFWNINRRAKRAELVNSKTDIVIDFVRWGMRGAIPRFNIDGIMWAANHMAWNWPNRDHHSEWAQKIVTPDADFIAHAREDVPYLLDKVARLRRELEETRELCRKSVGRLVGTIDSQGRPVVKDCLTAEVPKETP